MLSPKINTKFYIITIFRFTQALIEKDCKDETCGRMEEIYEEVLSGYNQFSLVTPERSEIEASASASDHSGVAHGIEL